jgi:hypothetical protein
LSSTEQDKVLLLKKNYSYKPESSSEFFDSLKYLLTEIIPTKTKSLLQEGIQAKFIIAAITDGDDTESSTTKIVCKKLLEELDSSVINSILVIPFEEKHTEEQKIFEQLKEELGFKTLLLPDGKRLRF